MTDPKILYLAPNAEWSIKTDDVISYIEAMGVTPLFLCVTGSHMWNLARPDSDLDVRGVYMEPVGKTLSLYPPKDTIEAVHVPEFEGMLDLQLYELRKALVMLNNSNGNLVEMLGAPTAFLARDIFRRPGAESWWAELAKSAHAKSLAKYYEGYFTSQRDRAAKNRGSKALVYTYREIFAGCILMAEGRVIYDFRELKEAFRARYQWNMALLDRFMARESWREPVGDELMHQFEAEWALLVEILHRAAAASSLPEKVDLRETLNSILVQFRFHSLKEYFR